MPKKVSDPKAKVAKKDTKIIVKKATKKSPPAKKTPAKATAKIIKKAPVAKKVSEKPLAPKINYHAVIFIQCASPLDNKDTPK